jgi:molecular chaperone GrpE
MSQKNEHPGTPDGRPTPAPTGSGGGGGQGAETDRPIPADGRRPDVSSAANNNAPEDGATSGDVDNDFQPNRAGDSATGVKPDGRPEGEGAASTPADVNATTKGDDAEDDEDADPATGGASAEAPAAAAAPVEEEPDWKDRYLRSVAELDNVRKRARRDAAMGEARGVSRLARELLPALDNLDRALAHVGDAEHDAQLVEGLRIVHRELHAALSSAGIEAFDPTGEQFDPRLHEALTQQPAGDAVTPGTIVTVYQAGYRRGDDVLRAAKVVVAG